jgi:dTDP-4-dehydrorhamnose reductase
MRSRVLILGATGMLGHVLLRELSQAEALDVYGSARDATALDGHVSAELLQRVASKIDVRNFDSVRWLLDDVQPEVVINCVGVIKQDPGVGDAINTISVNALFPHLLARESRDRGARLIQISTDCVFSGKRGRYVEVDDPDPGDMYGRSKLLGEVPGPALTLRTSIIGHELVSHRSLVDWFLSQSSVVYGYTRAMYSGVTTYEFARLLKSVVIPREDLAGLHHVAASPISKYDLLRLIADVYGWTGPIAPFDGFSCDRSMSADEFHALTGYRPPAWPQMIAEMRRSALNWGLLIAGRPEDVLTSAARQVTGQ